MATDQIKEVLKMDDQIHALAKELHQQKSLLVMGRGFNYATCLEGALVSCRTTLAFCRTSLTVVTVQRLSLVVFPLLLLPGNIQVLYRLAGLRSLSLLLLLLSLLLL